VQSGSGLGQLHFIGINLGTLRKITVQRWGQGYCENQKHRGEG